MQFTFGKIVVKKITETVDVYPMAAMFPEVVSADLRHLREWFPCESSSDKPQTFSALLSVHSYILQCGGKNMLIDSCHGNGKSRTVLPFGHQLQSPYLKNMGDVGLTPDDIDYVLCTHLHYDHIGWNTKLENGQWVPTFKNARYLFTRLDYEFLGSHTADPLYSEGYYDSILPVIEHGLADLVETTEVVQHEADNGVWLTGAPGHSPGSCCINASANDETLTFTGDVFHHPIQLIRPDARFVGDDDPAQAIQTRTRLLSQTADDNRVVFPAHFCGASGGRVRRNKGVYKFDFLVTD